MKGVLHLVVQIYMLHIWTAQSSTLIENENVKYHSGVKEHMSLW